MDFEDDIGELFADCPTCFGNGCELCLGRGILLSEKGREARVRGDEMMKGLPTVSREAVAGIVKRLRAADRGIRVVTEDGERIPDLYKRPKR